MAQPYLQSVSIDACKQSASAEFSIIARTVSASVIVKNIFQSSSTAPGTVNAPSVSVEGRYYFEGNGFASFRIGTSGNIGLGCGIKCRENNVSHCSVTPRLGIYWNRSDPKQLNPIVGLSLDYEL